jgi:hypothetical protein
MTDVRYPISGNIRAIFIPEGGLANEKAPTEAECSAGLDISDAISWNDKDFGVQASNTVEDPAITAKGKVLNRGAAQFGGGLSFYYPKDRTDNTSIYKLTEDALGSPGVRGYIIFRVDGLELATEAGDSSHPGTDFEAGDFVTVYKVKTAGYAQAITGEEAFRYTVSFLPKGFVKVNAIVRASATPVAPVISGASTAAVGDVIVLSATLVGRPYTRGLDWRTSTPAVGAVRKGIVRALGTGTISVTAIDPATGTASTAKTITVS